MKTDTYIVHWPLGAGGAFLISIVYNMIDPNVRLTTNFGKNGDAHDITLDRCGGTWDSVTGDLYWNNHADRPHATPIYEIVRRNPGSEFFMLYDHVPPDYDRMFSILPNCKNIVITADERVIPRTLGAFFYKVNAGDPPNTEFWEREKQVFPYLRGINNAIDMPTEVAKMYFDDTISGFPRLPFYHDFKIPEAYKNNILEITYYDLIHEKNKVLSLMSAFIGAPITDEIHNFYDVYLEKQQELIDTRMPWINDK